jgi:hypothetical protein
MGGNQINMAVGAEFMRRRTSCGREWVQIRSTCLSVLDSQDSALLWAEWVEIRSTWPSKMNSQDDALPVGETGGNQINMAIGAEFTRRRTSCGRE